MGLTYVGPDGAEHMPYCIHRAPFSTHERMVAFLIEHFGGAFPTWLAPVQVQVITVSEHYEAYGRSIVDRLRNQLVRAELATQSETVSKKIREGTTRKIPLAADRWRTRAGRRHRDAASLRADAAAHDDD